MLPVPRQRVAIVAEVQVDRLLSENLELIAENIRLQSVVDALKASHAELQRIVKAIAQREAA